MGQKSNPIGLRLQINRTWDSRWYAEGRNYAQLLKEDIELRKYIIKTLPQAAISKVVIERPAKLCRISIYAARPGVIIGIKCWIFKGEILGHDPMAQDRLMMEAQTSGVRPAR